MRLRNITGSRDIIAESPLVIHEPEKVKGKWSELFGNNFPIRIEVGMGKGRFICELARNSPDINYIGIEKYSSVLLRALQKMEEEPLPNLLFIRMDAENIAEIFDKEEVDRIYLNFSDPWPKKRHEKRRLTYKSFLAVDEQILKPAGEIHFKTDNQGLFEYSLASFSQYGMTILQVWLDLHHSNYEGNIMTEYEEKFSSRGQRIYRVEARFNGKQ